VYQTHCEYPPNFPPKNYVGLLTEVHKCYILPWFIPTLCQAFDECRISDRYLSSYIQIQKISILQPLDIHHCHWQLCWNIIHHEYLVSRSVYQEIMIRIWSLLITSLLCVSMCRYSGLGN